MAQGGYDISASSSDATTQGNQVGAGTWTVGGGIRIPEWFWPVAAIVTGFVLWKFFDRKRRK